MCIVKKIQEVSMKRWYAGILVVLFLALTTTVFAYGPRGGFGPGGCGSADPSVGGPGGGLGGPMGLAANLNLSKEQMDKMWQMREKFRNDTQKLRYELFQKRLEMKTIFSDPKADDATIVAKQKELSALRQNMTDKMVEFRLAQRKILTPEQLKKLSETQAGPGFDRMGMGYGSRHGRGYGDCGPGWGRGPGYGPGRNWN
jgi:Spy/CpxP family protein refolding chaperone